MGRILRESGIPTLEFRASIVTESGELDAACFRIHDRDGRRRNVSHFGRESFWSAQARLRFVERQLAAALWKSGGGKLAP